MHYSRDTGLESVGLCIPRTSTIRALANELGLTSDEPAARRRAEWHVRELLEQTDLASADRRS